jgi:hypothetical protein
MCHGISLLLPDGLIGFDWKWSTAEEKGFTPARDITQMLDGALPLVPVGATFCWDKASIHSYITTGRCPRITSCGMMKE